jgi:hypothetical protein
MESINGILNLLLALRWRTYCARGFCNYEAFVVARDCSHKLNQMDDMCEHIDDSLIVNVLLSFGMQFVV